ncbi:MAG: signal peptidase II [Desulfovibrionaceae bacterium]|nr:signal peptidase II [Desulfovibrionaceae bacterium]
MAGTARTDDGRYRVIFWLTAACVALDQATKAAVTASLPLHGSMRVVPGLFDLVHVRNRGAAFGFLNRSDMDWQFWLFLLATLVACGLILGMARTARYSRTLFVGFGLILGGAVGNLIDRVRLRAVIDFLDFYMGVWHWPAFNVADVAICVGALLAAFVLWFRSGAAGPSGNG